MHLVCYPLLLIGTWKKNLKDFTYSMFCNNKRTNSFNYSSKHGGHPSMFPINPVIKLAVISHNFSKHRQMFSALPFDPGRI